ncbi:MAG: hypothetical protein U0821_21825 [Chloroflexota bacterium]
MLIRVLRRVSLVWVVTYAALVVVIAGSWLIASGRIRGPYGRMFGMAGQATPTDLVRLDQAVASVRRFAGDPRLQLEGGLQTDPVGSRTIALYHLETVHPVRGEDFYKVDARTGEVLEATMRTRLTLDPPLGVGENQAQRAAATFAQTRFLGFDSLVLVERSTRATDGTTVYSFKWSQVASDSGAELPVSVSLAVSATSGSVVWYLAQRDALQIDPHPAVDRAAAVEAAAVRLRASDPRWDTSSPISVRLQVLYDDDNEQQLVWSVTFPSRVPGARPSIRRLVDAQSGEVIGAG